MCICIVFTDQEAADFLMEAYINNGSQPFDNAAQILVRLPILMLMYILAYVYYTSYICILMRIYLYTCDIYIYTGDRVYI